jgi:tRNA pseudouridine32 synthase/23S rRNA pseudouridine746 synthase
MISNSPVRKAESMENSQTPRVLTSTLEWIAVIKPSGWLSIPGRENSPVLSKWVQEQFPEALVVHRLDRETSGILLMARSPEAHRKANSWFQNRQVKKIYHCLALGSPTDPIFRINQPIEGANSVTQVEIQERFSSAFLAQVLPRTGRRHQIRIHLSSQGHPILGDTLYRGPREISVQGETLSVSRVALHASSLELPTGEKFQAAFPPDFEFWLDWLRKGKDV